MGSVSPHAPGSGKIAACAGRVPVCHTQSFAASTIDSNSTEYNGCLRRKRNCVSPLHRRKPWRSRARELRTRYALRNIPFTPYLSVPIRRGAAVMPSMAACAPLYPAHLFAVELPPSPVRALVTKQPLTSAEHTRSVRAGRLRNSHRAGKYTVSSFSPDLVTAAGMVRGGCGSSFGFMRKFMIGSHGMHEPGL